MKPAVRLRRAHSSTAAPPHIVHIPKASVYRFGDPNGARHVLRDVEWTVREGESWAVVGSGSGEKTALLETLLGSMRLSPPPPGGPFPFLAAAQTPRAQHEQIALVSFAHRAHASGGAFYDYTARYGAVREEDRVTLRQSMFPEEAGAVQAFVVSEQEQEHEEDAAVKEERGRRFEELVERLELAHLLDLPLVALSNGQTRRARIVKALLSRPELLLLDEPLTGLDVHTRPNLLALLRDLHASRSPRVVMGLRMQDPVPDWISHLALVGDGRVRVGPRAEILEHIAYDERNAKEVSYTAGATNKPDQAETEKEALVEMQNVNVKYHERHVLKDINWTIRAGDRWHLQGANGSGKTTLLSVLTGDHPQSYTQRAPSSSLSLFGAPRRAHATASLRTRIGVVSPELYNAWPRARPMTVFEAIATGFDGGFVPLGERGLGNGLAGTLTSDERAWRERRVWDVLRGLGPHTWYADDVPAEAMEQFAGRPFAGLSAGAQGVVLLMRALVGRPPLVLLDEVWAGMDEGMVKAARRYLTEGDGVGEEQAVVVISHWEDEVPWGVEDGVKRYKLDKGEGKQI